MAIFEALEVWAASQGARWLRLEVVKGHARAERFWERAGFVEARTRDAVQIGDRVQMIRVMSKALAGGSMVAYLAMVPRDRAEP